MSLKETLDQLAFYAKGMRVLYVEDENQIRENTQLLLSKIFSDVQTATNGNQGLALYQSSSFDLVITDILMPEMNGVAMIRKIKELTPSQPFIVTSACEESNYLVDLINLGVAQFLIKPMKTDQIIKILNEVVQNIYNGRIRDGRKVKEFKD